MGKLTGQTIASSYDQLLIVDDANGISASLQAIESADTGGSASALKIATNKVEVIPGSDDANAFEVSQADGTAVLTVDSSTPAVSFNDNNITNVGDISLDSISSDAGTSVTVTLGTDAGDDFIVGNNNAFVVEGDNDRVGIGTESPSVGLEVANGDFLVEKSDAGGTIDIKASNSDNSNSSSNARLIASVGGSSAGDPKMGVAVTGVRDYFFRIDNSDSDKLILDTNGTDIMTIDSSGNVGIGETSPSTSFHVKRTSGGAGIKVESTATSGEGSLTVAGKNSGGTARSMIVKYDNSDLFRIGTADAVDMRFETNDTERMRIDSSGNVGISKTPNTWHANKIVIQMGDRASLAGDSVGSHSTFLINNAYHDSGSGLWKYQETAEACYFYEDSGQFRFYTAPSGTAGTDITFSNRLQIDQDGNVGIGTESPSSLLEVAGADGTDGGELALTVLNSNVGTNDIIGKLVWKAPLENSPDGLLPGAAIWAEAQASYTASVNKTSLFFGTGNSESALSNKRMTIDSSGNVGIGDDNPSRNLVVQNTSDNVLVSLVTGTTDTCQLLFGDTDADTIGKILYHNNGDYMAFNTNDAERLRIDSSGNVIIGSPVTTTRFCVQEDVNDILAFYDNGATSGNMYMHKWKFTGASPNNNTSYFISLEDSSADRLKIFSNGNVQNVNNSYGALSDKKLKQNIKKASSQWDDVKALSEQVKKFRLKSDVKQYGQDAEYRLGFVAQDIEEISPHLVRNNPETEQVEINKTDEDGNVIYKTEQTLVSEAVDAEYDEDGNELTSAQEAVYETITTDEPETEMEMQETGEYTKSVKYSIAYMKAFKALGEAMEKIEQLEAKVEALENA